MGKPIISHNSARKLDVEDISSLDVFLANSRFDFVINGIGLIKQLIDYNSERDAKLAYVVNSEFPAILDDFSIRTSTPVIQIGTDCVYSGSRGKYDEESQFDCTDVYGHSKVEGESRSKSLMTLRCSIIGHEIKSNVSLMDWFLKQPVGAKVKGFTNHYWNGITTLEFSRVISGVIATGNVIPGTTHLIPANQVSKFELLTILSRYFDRGDVEIEAFEAEESINRTLSTIFPERNSDLWGGAGYNQPPTVQEMVQRYSLWTR
jgi:dTDP-4-dehydrorhamnose reductase